MPEIQSQRVRYEAAKVYILFHQIEKDQAIDSRTNFQAIESTNQVRIYLCKIDEDCAVWKNFQTL